MLFTVNFRPPYAVISVAVVMSLFKLWLVSGQTLQALGTYLYDDLLFINHARSLLSGDWLGAYNELTLVKGAFYPIWVATMSMLGAPLLMAQQMFYVVICMVFVVAIRPVLKSPMALLLVYLVLLFNPMSFTDGVATRVLRDGIYPALTILIMAGATGLLVRIDSPLKSLAIWSVILGVAAAMFSLTREEGIWMVPAIVLVMSMAGWRIWSKPMRWPRLALCLLPVAVWLTAIGAVSAVNMQYYGTFRTVDIKAPGFLAAYGSLARVKSEERHPTIPVPQDVREKVYKISPAFAELLPYLDEEEGLGWKGRDWRLEGRFSYWNWGDESIDIHGGRFVWALRDAVALAGHYKSAKDAESFYQRLANEVNTACDNRLLQCGTERATVMPVWHDEYNLPLFYTFLRALSFTIGFEGFKPEPFLSWGPKDSLYQFADITHEELFLASKGQLNIRGWAFSPGKKVRLSVSRHGGRDMQAVIRYGQSPYVYQRFLDRGLDIPEAREAQFELTTPCLAGCSLDIHAEGRLIGRLPLDADIKSTYTSELYFGVDFADSGETGASPVFVTTMKTRLDVLKAIGLAYQGLAPWLFGLAALCYVAYTLRLLRQRRLTALWVITSALLGSVLARVLMVAMIDLISFPAIQTLYLASAYPLLLLFVCIMLTQARRVLIKL